MGARFDAKPWQVSRSNEYRRQWAKARRLRLPELCMLERAERRARTKGLDFTIDITDIVIPKRCPVLGFKLKQGKGKNNPKAPTLDRRDNTKGYIKGNVVVVSWRANTLKSDATPDELRRLADFYEK